MSSTARKKTLHRRLSVFPPQDAKAWTLDLSGNRQRVEKRNELSEEPEKAFQSVVTNGSFMPHGKKENPAELPASRSNSGAGTEKRPNQWAIRLTLARWKNQQRLPRLDCRSAWLRPAEPIPGPFTCGDRMEVARGGSALHFETGRQHCEERKAESSFGRLLRFGSDDGFLGNRQGLGFEHGDLPKRAIHVHLARSPINVHQPKPDRTFLICRRLPPERQPMKAATAIMQVRAVLPVGRCQGSSSGGGIFSGDSSLGRYPWHKITGCRGYFG